jgi:hypothetical protein
MLIKKIQTRKDFQAHGIAPGRERNASENIVCAVVFFSQVESKTVRRQGLGTPLSIFMRTRSSHIWPLLLLVWCVWALGGCEEEDMTPLPPKPEVDKDEFFAAMRSEKLSWEVSAIHGSKTQLDSQMSLRLPPNPFGLDSSCMDSVPTVSAGEAILRSPAYRTAMDLLIDSVRCFWADSFVDYWARYELTAYRADNGTPLTLAEGKSMKFLYHDSVALTSAASGDSSSYLAWTGAERFSSLRADTSWSAPMHSMGKVGLAQVQRIEGRPVQVRLRNAPAEGRHFVFVRLHERMSTAWGEPIDSTLFEIPYLYSGVRTTFVGLSFFEENVFISTLDTTLQAPFEPVDLRLEPDKPDNVARELRALTQ